jgi:hypothetical protein
MDVDIELATAQDGDDMGGVYREETSGEATSPEAESSEVSRARAHAEALSKAASAARARYARLTSAPTGVRDRKSQYDKQMGSIRDSMAAQGSRVEGLETALAGGTVLNTIGNELQKSFPAVADHPVVKVGLPWAPLLFLKPAKRGRGVGSFAADPRVWSAVLASGGLAIASGIKKWKPRGIAGLRITRIEKVVDVGTENKVQVEAFDYRGRSIPAHNVTFASSNRRVAKVNKNGVVRAVGGGGQTTTITAMMDGFSDQVSVKVQ